MWLGRSWIQLKPWFLPRQHDGPAAVCIPPGTELRVVSLNPVLRERLGLGETEDATFIQVSTEAFTYRDGIQFRNGKRILLQELPEGQRIFIWSSITSHAPFRRQNVPEETHAS
jgi:hypothetical protein